MPRHSPETQLDRIARTYAHIAAQARALASLEREIVNHLERNVRFTVIAADTAIAENYTNPAACLAWLTASHRSWLRSNERFNREVGRQIFYRYILLPNPSLIQNWQKRQILIDVILLHLHLQLWHGVFCGIVFLDPRRKDISRVLHDLNFLSIPSHHLFLDTPAFYREDEINTTAFADSDATKRLKQVSELLFPEKRGRAIWLHYDEANFATKRLRGWRWEALRAFFRALYGPRLFCVGCHREMGAFELDHIAPFVQGFPQTLVNFRPLCQRCNREKGATLAEDPFQLRLMLPMDLPAGDMDIILRFPPSWLGSVTAPSTVRDLRGELSR